MTKLTHLNIYQTNLEAKLYKIKDLCKSSLYLKIEINPCIYL